MNAEALIVKTSSTVTANIIEEDFTNTSAETFWVSYFYLLTKGQIQPKVDWRRTVDSPKNE